ncbi:transposase [Actinomadura sp. NPDC048021]|uniref:IS110 family transposase n=1 Tax=Actinomadura sp. NPDC048021 TaxID=3155385 RepID=UPI0033C10E8C
MQALIASGYRVYAIKFRQVARFKERVRLLWRPRATRVKSDKGDAHALADMVRIDRAQLRAVAVDSAQAQAVKDVARAHQTLIWEGTRTFQLLRSTLREYFPAALNAYADQHGRTGTADQGIHPGSRGQADPHPDHRRPSPRPPTRPGHQSGQDPDRAAPTTALSARAGHRRRPRHLITALKNQIAAIEEQVKAHFQRTRTLRSTCRCPASRRLPAPGCSPSSETTPPATSPPKHARLRWHQTDHPGFRQEAHRPGPPRPQQPPRRHPSRMPQEPHPLRRSNRLVTSHPSPRPLDAQTTRGV